MTSPPTTATALTPFVPGGRNFEQAIAFFGELGFVVQWRHEGLAGLRFGGAAFMLQDIDVPEWQTNQMHVIEVLDLDAYWGFLAGKGLDERYAGVLLKAPHDYPWDREVHLIDPAGVCWHVRQAKTA